ncbi:MAG: hypothetical protein WC823_00170 [Parcubacteria group bacterium]|jgi:hypothetical protein
MKKKFDIYCPPKVVILDGLEYLQFKPGAWTIIGMPDTMPEPRIINLKDKKYV